jgi:hypothetical protein
MFFIIYKKAVGGTVKFDKDVVREILLAIEASGGDPRGLIAIEIPGKSQEEVAYHIQLLDEAGFIEAEDLGDLCNYDWRAKRLTFQGHEFLDTVRDPEIWRKTKEGASKIGGVGVELLFTIGKAYAKQLLQEKLGIHLP